MVIQPYEQARQVRGETMKIDTVTQVFIKLCASTILAGLAVESTDSRAKSIIVSILFDICWLIQSAKGNQPTIAIVGQQIDQVSMGYQFLSLIVFIMLTFVGYSMLAITQAVTTIFCLLLLWRQRRDNTSKLLIRLIS